MANVTFDRSYVEVLNTKKIRTVYDFAYGEYIALNRFFAELSNIQSGILNNNGKIKIPTGEIIDINTVGGSLALTLALETLDTTKETTTGLSKLGLKNENKLWTLLG